MNLKIPFLPPENTDGALLPGSLPQFPLFRASQAMHPPHPLALPHISTPWVVLGGDESPTGVPLSSPPPMGCHSPLLPAAHPLQHLVAELGLGRSMEEPWAPHIYIEPHAQTWGGHGQDGET